LLVVVLVIAVLVVAVVGVAVAAAGEVEDEEPDPSGDEDATDDQVLGAFDEGAQLKPDEDDAGAEHERQRDVRDPGQERESSDVSYRVSPRSAQDRQRDPVVG
jgi:hypothetical protein